jgi:hypothetical protein
MDVNMEARRRETELQAVKGRLKALEAQSAVIVSALVIGFFVIAGIDPNVRQEIFGSQLGIQFITLFSLVIATGFYSAYPAFWRAESSRLCSAPSLGTSLGDPALRLQRGRLMRNPKAGDGSRTRRRMHK